MTARLQKWLGVTGLGFVVLVVVASFIVPTEPNSHASAAKVITDYHKNKTAVQISAFVIELAIFIGLFFFWYLRDYVAEVGTSVDGASLRLASPGQSCSR